MKRVTLCLFFLAVSICTKAQQIEPKAYFHQDTMSLAEPVQFSLMVEYPSELTVLFPDSTFNYFPFEFRSKKYYPTQTDSVTSYDRVDYTLASFELDQLQSLKLPVFIIKGEDSISIFSNADSIVFSEMIPVVSDSLKAKPDANYVTVKKEFNYPYFMIALVILAIITAAIIIFFGKKIVLRYRIYRIRKRHKKFLESFIGFDQLNDKIAIEQKLVQWKRHAEFLSNKPYAKYTTREISLLVNEEQLKLALQKIDRAIYSSKGKDSLTESFNYLKHYATTIFENRVKELQGNGRH